jgi:hypothetical protein
LTTVVEAIVALLDIILLLLLVWLVASGERQATRAPAEGLLRGMHEALRRHVYEAPLTFEERQAARARAEALLRSVIGEEAYRGLQQRLYLEVPSPSIRKRIYRIPNGRGRVKVYEDTRFVMSLCVAPTTPLPAGDLVLMHKLMIEANEAYYLSVANQLDLVNLPEVSEYDIFR